MIRVKGRHDGVKAYLEDGRKAGRELDRDDLDERVVLDGDLDVTDAIIQMINVAPNVDRYLSITLSFKEDAVDRATLDAVVRDFKSFVFSAYRPDEMNFYAEAHLPRVKSYIDQKTGELVERKPHIHVVIPKLNLVSGMHLEPLGYVKKNLAFIDAIQEHINAQYGLASPKDNRRVELTDASEMLSRYRGDLFKPVGRELKEALLDAVLDRGIERYEDFMTLLAEHGAVRMRNAGSDDEYPNVKPPEAAKGVNLKDFVFSREFIELSTEEKRAQLSADATANYEDRKAPRATPHEIEVLLDEWCSSRAREVKYLNSGNALQWARYYESSAADRQLMLDELERGFYAQHLREFHDDDTSGFAPLRPDDVERPFDGPFDSPFDDITLSGPPAGFEPGGPGGASIDADDEFGAWADEQEFAPEPFDLVRALSSSAVVRVPEGRTVLLPDHADDYLEPERPVSAYRLRRPRDRDREIARERESTGRVADNAISQRTRDVHERQRERAASGEFGEIRRRLSGERLLAELSHSHGVLPQKYMVVTGKDGGTRIRAGRRHLTVSDFLTKELNLPWREAAPLLKAVYQRQLDGHPIPRVREQPRAALWREYVMEREARGRARQNAWQNQREGERSRRDTIVETFEGKRTALRQDPTMSRATQRQALSAARFSRALDETSLAAAVRHERDALKAQHGPASGPTFTEWLQERAQGGDVAAIAELRRTGKPTEPDRRAVGVVRSPGAVEWRENAIVFGGQDLALSVSAGGSICYSRDGHDLIVDRGNAVDVLAIDRAALEAGLRLSQMKFGRTLELEGSATFQQAAVEVAAAAGLSIQFSDAALNRALTEARHVRIDSHLQAAQPSRVDTAVGSPVAQHIETVDVVPSSQPEMKP
nr:LPD7 domain-containing protein [Burkholderia cenocepacia]